MPRSYLRTSDGARLAFQADGPASAPAIVLAHSLGTDLDLWRAQAEALAGRFCVVRYDLRGHGASSAPAGDYDLGRLGRDVLDLMDELGLARTSFCGLSLGGMVGQWLGAHAPERLDRLVLCNTSAFTGPEAWSARIAAVRSQGLAAIWDAVAERWFASEFRTARPDVVEAARRTFVATDLAGYVGCCAAIRDMDLRPVLAGIGAPCLVIGGSEDQATPVSDAALLAKTIPGARLQVLPTGHLSSLERPAALGAAIADFLQARPAANAAPGGA